MMYHLNTYLFGLIVIHDHCKRIIGKEMCVCMCVKNI